MANKGIKSLWGYPLIDSKGRHAIDDVRSNLENNFQKKNDDTLTTTNKTISGAINEVNAQYKDIANNKADKNSVFTMANMGQDIKEAMTGGSVAVVGKNAILEENIVEGQVTPICTSFFDELSILTSEQFKDGKFWNNGSLQDWTQTPSWSYIENSIIVTPENTYAITGVTDYHIDLLNSDGTLSRHLTINNGTVFTTQSNEVAINVSCLTSEKYTIKIRNNNYDKEQIGPEYLEKNNNLIESRIIPKINKLNQECFVINKNGSIVVDGNKVTFTDVRMSWRGSFYQLEAPITVDMGSNSFSYCKAIFTDVLIADTAMGKCYKFDIKVITDKAYWQGINDLKYNEVILIFRNDGDLKSNYIYIENKLSETEKIINTTTIKVKQGGQVGTDCDYTDIVAAMNSIVDNDYYNRYTVLVEDGVYDYSNNGENIGVKLKDYVTIEGVNKSTVIIQKIDDNFAWEKATIDVGVTPVYYAKIKNITLLSKNCKCPLHIDNNNLKGTFEGENLDLINLQDRGTGDFPDNDVPNCGAFGWMNDCHIKLKNVRANGKLWGHNYCDTNSNGTLEFINCNAKKLQFGDLTSHGNDKITVKGCKADIFEHLWFSENESSKGRKPSYEFDLEGNNINRTVLKDHAETHDALNEYFKGKYPFNLNEIHTYCYCTEDVQVGDIVYKKNFDNLFEVTKVENAYKVGKVIENKFNNMVMIERI